MADLGLPGWLAVPAEPIVDYARDVLGFELYPGQAATLSRLYRDAYRILVAGDPRRAGVFSCRLTGISSSAGGHGKKTGGRGNSVPLGPLGAELVRGQPLMVTTHSGIRTRACNRRAGSCP